MLQKPSAANRNIARVAPEDKEQGQQKQATRALRETEEQKIEEKTRLASEKHIETREIWKTAKKEGKNDWKNSIVNVRRLKEE